MISLIKTLLRRAGVDIVRATHVPVVTLAGHSNRSIRTILDVGANRGQFGRYIRSLFPDARVYCFEPLAEPFQALTKWAASLPERPVVPVQTAIGAKDGSIEMFFHEAHDESSSVLPSTQELGERFPNTRLQVSRSVPLQRLDTWAANIDPPIQAPVLLKLDVQGYEVEALEGAGALLDSVEICITEVSVARLYEGQPSFGLLAGLLESRGLRYAGNLKQNYDAVGRVVFLDAVFVRS